MADKKLNLTTLILGDTTGDDGLGGLNVNNQILTPLADPVTVLDAVNLQTLTQTIDNSIGNDFKIEAAGGNVTLKTFIGTLPKTTTVDLIWETANQQFKLVRTAGGEPEDVTAEFRNDGQIVGVPYTFPDSDNFDISTVFTHLLDAAFPNVYLSEDAELDTTKSLNNISDRINSSTTVVLTFPSNSFVYKVTLFSVRLNLFIYAGFRLAQL